MSNTQAPLWKTKLPQLSLILITMIWGTTFVIVKYGLSFSSPVLFVAFRFIAAALAVMCISGKHLKAMTPYDVFAGAVIGLMIALGYGTQTVGLKMISSSESAFLTALYVPLVPILLWLLFGKKPYVMTWIGAGLAFIGLVILTGNGFGAIQLNFGQVLTILGSIAIALEIIFISYFAEKVNLQCVTVLQLIFASLFCFIAAPLLGENHLPTFQWPLIMILVGLGCASAFIQLVMNWAQRQVEPSQAAIIYAAEPVWAAMFGRLAGERLPILALLGGALVVIGIIVSECKVKLLNKNKTDQL